jgi:hypothetical protein
MPVAFSTCAPSYHWGEISKVYIAPADFLPFDLTVLGNWTSRLADTGDDKIRTLIGIGDMPEPEITEVTTSGDRKAYSSRQYTINFTIDETGSVAAGVVIDNYSWMAMTGCNTNYQFWFETSDGVLYTGGPDSGLEGTGIFHQIIPRLRTELVTFVGTFKWQSYFAPYRMASPMAV